MKIGDNEIARSISVELKFDNNFILSTDEYSYKIMDLFFNEFIDKNICKMNDLTVSYYKYITCSEKVLEALDRFPTLTFLGTDVNNDPYHIDFTAKDLFEDIEGTVYFKVIIMKPISKFMLANDAWKIGKIFFRKYVVTLDRRRKTITFYTHTHLVNIYNTINENKTHIQNNTETESVNQSSVVGHSYNNITIIIMISFIIVSASIIFAINVKKLRKNKKKSKKLEKNEDNGEEMTYYSVEY